jgi:hypothetical protein
MQLYDIIGDVHGHANALEKLLLKLGYTQGENGFRHSERKTVFVGDLIDRGPENFKTMKIVKAMTDSGQAHIVMGNHEFNALCFHTPNTNGTYLRPHVSKNITQHETTLKEIEERGEKEWNIYLEWFRRMPLFLELDGFRVVHACWDHQSILCVRTAKIRDENGRLTDTFLAGASTEGTALFDMVETLLKGKEIWLPRDHPGLHDKDGHLRRKVRVTWWMTDEERNNAETYDHVTRTHEENLRKLSSIKIPPSILDELKRDNGNAGDTPIFIGHYWFSGKPAPLTGNVACLDYSIAKGGHLACYRWDGEQILSDSKFIFV